MLILEIAAGVALAPVLLLAVYWMLYGIAALVMRFPFAAMIAGVYAVSGLYALVTS